jgi:hypothetical protein
LERRKAHLFAIFVSKIETNEEPSPSFLKLGSKRESGKGELS